MFIFTAEENRFMQNFKAAKEFYNKLKKKGMSKLMTDFRNRSYLSFLRKNLSKRQKILDLACGYGRLTVPLAKEGYSIEGLDLTPSLIKEAKLFAKKEKIKINFKVGNMCSLPYKAESFDAIICMWSSFNHLIHERDQITAVKEIYRVLKNSGTAIVDMPKYNRPTVKQLKFLRHSGKDNHLCHSEINGLKFVDFIHDKNTLRTVLKKAKIKYFSIKTENIFKRRRLLLYIFKRGKR